MIRSVAARALWLAKGAALFWGAVVTLALVLGVGTMALAAVPGDPFKLGQTNTINNALTRLAGTNAGGPMLVVDNDSSASGSRALDLRVEAGRAPINVNADAGRAANLNADKLDGKDSGDFLGSNVVVRTSENDLGNGFLGATENAFCDAQEGEVATGGGAAVLRDGATEEGPPNIGDFVVAQSRPIFVVAGDDAPTGWQASIFDFDGVTNFNGQFTMRVYAVCTVGADAP